MSDLEKLETDPTHITTMPSLLAYIEENESFHGVLDTFEIGNVDDTEITGKYTD